MKIVGKIKEFIKKHLVHFSYFYSQLGYKVLVALGLSLIVGVLDGFGLAMFLPLLQMIDGEARPDDQTLGGMEFLIEGLEKIGIGLTLQSVLVTILVFFVLKGGVKFCQSYYNVLTLQTFTRNLRVRFAKKLGNYDFQSFVGLDSGMIQNTLSGEVGRVSMSFKSYFLTIQSGVLVLVYLVLALLTNFQFALLVAIGGGLSNLIYKNIFKKTKITSKKITKGGHRYQSLLIQKVAFFKYLKATGLMDQFYLQIKNAIEYIENSNKKIGFYNSLVVAAREPLVITVVVVVIMIQVNFFSESIGAIVLSLLFFYRSLNALVELQNQWNNFLNVSGSLENVIQFEKTLDTDQVTNGQIGFSRLDDAIVFDNVSFGFTGVKVLNDISLTIPVKSTFAFIGESGSGKSTLVNLVAGLFNPTQGKVIIDGVATSELDKSTYLSKIGYITQDPIMFSDSIYNNITLWAPKNTHTIKRFWEALRKASIDKFVQDLKNGEDTILGNNGIQVSGGQKQRLSIARELYKDVEILIMDEATSALDSETERLIQENIDSLKGKYTILIVAHRLSTIKSADQIILLNKGKILAKGDFKTLMHESPIVRNMVALQEV